MKIPLFPHIPSMKPSLPKPILYKVSLSQPSVFSRREKLLLGLLSLTLLGSFSLSYGAVSQSKVDSIMAIIVNGGSKFSDTIVSPATKSEKTLYYEKVDAGL